MLYAIIIIMPAGARLSYLLYWYAILLSFPFITFMLSRYYVFFFSYCLLSPSFSLLSLLLMPLLLFTCCHYYLLYILCYYFLIYAMSLFLSYVIRATVFSCRHISIILIIYVIYAIFTPYYCFHYLFHFPFSLFIDMSFLLYYCYADMLRHLIFRYCCLFHIWRFFLHYCCFASFQHVGPFIIFSPLIYLRHIICHRMSPRRHERAFIIICHYDMSVNMLTSSFIILHVDASAADMLSISLRRFFILLLYATTIDIPCWYYFRLLFIADLPTDSII